MLLPGCRTALCRQASYEPFVVKFLLAYNLGTDNKQHSCSQESQLQSCTNRNQHARSFAAAALHVVLFIRVRQPLRSRRAVVRRPRGGRGGARARRTHRGQRTNFVAAPRLPTTYGTLLCIDLISFCRHYLWTVAAHCAAWSWGRERSTLSRALVSVGYIHRGGRNREVREVNTVEAPDDTKQRRPRRATLAGDGGCTGRARCCSAPAEATSPRAERLVWRGQFECLRSRWMPVRERSSEMVVGSQ